MGNYHAGFWSVSGPGDWPTDRSGVGAASTRFHVRSSSAAPLEAVVSEWDWLLYLGTLWSMAGVVVLVTMLNARREARRAIRVGAPALCPGRVGCSGGGTEAEKSR